VRGILDTSVFIADEQGRALSTDELPAEAAVSVVTLAELELSVHMATTEDPRARRLATLRALSETYVAVPIDAPVASSFAELVAGARRSGRRLRVQDAWIAATAKAHGAAVYTQDADFEGLPGLDVVRV
jgi:predicted nucleic acid-binding protein